MKIYLFLCKIFLYQIKDFDKYIKWKFKLGFINSNGSPKRCHNCGNKNFKDKIIDTLDGHTILEYESYCIKCNTLSGYWSYGSWMP